MPRLPHPALPALFATTLLLFVPGCHKAENPARAPIEAKVPADHRFSLTVGGQSIQVRLAVHEAERRQGLMHINSMPADEGMLFVWSTPQRMSFYMRNTNIPLDIGFFDADGRLQEIYPMYPHVEDPVASRSDQLKFALEMNQGWFADRGVRPGAVLDLAGLRAALRDRGIDPDRYVSSK